MVTTLRLFSSCLGNILSLSRSVSCLGLGAAPALDRSVRPKLVAYSLLCTWNGVICPAAIWQASGVGIVCIVLLYFCQYVAGVVVAGATGRCSTRLDYLRIGKPVGVISPQLLLCPCPNCPVIERYFKQRWFSTFCLAHHCLFRCRAWGVQVNGCAPAGAMGLQPGQ